MNLNKIWADYLMIYINGRFLTQNITGVQRFAEEISLQLNELRNDIVFLVPDIKSVKKHELINFLNVEEVSGLKGHLWEQITLPLYLLKRKKPLLINLCNTAPVIYSNQIITHHDITYRKYPKSFPLSFRLLYRIISPLIIRNSNKIITVSDFSKKEISECYKCDPEKIAVIYNAVSEYFKPSDVKINLSDSESYFLAVSSTNYHKNFHGLIEAFVSSELNINLKIIGGGSEVFSKLNLNRNHPKIKFLGRVEDKELVLLYQNAKGFVFPSFYEGFGIPPLEAQACGCPVISSDAASMPEVLGNSVLYFEPKSKEEIINALELIDSDPTLRMRLIDNGYKNVARFSWGDSAWKLNEIIESFNS